MRCTPVFFNIEDNVYMYELRLAKVSAEHAERISEYIASFPHDRERVTYEADRIPGLDHLEQFGSVEEWLDFCEKMTGKIDWFLSERAEDGVIVGSIVLRRSLEYDDDDEEFCSHIGYSVRPDERGKGYAKQQLSLCLAEAEKLGIERVRLVCIDTNTASRRTIEACGGVYIDTLHGEESGLNVCRYDIPLKHQPQ